MCASRAPHLTVHFTAHFTASLSRIRLIDYLPRFLQASTGVLPRLIFLPPTEFAKEPEEATKGIRVKVAVKRATKCALKGALCPPYTSTHS